MANKFDLARAKRETPAQNGLCQMFAERGFHIIGAYPSAFAAYQAATTKRGGTPPNDGNYYIIYFDGWYNLGNGLKRYGDVVVYRNGKVWSGSNVRWRDGTDLATYKNWLKTPQLAWSEFLGSRRIATIPAKPAPKPVSGRVAQKGTFTANTAMSIRRTPSTKNNVPVAVLLKGQSVKYDSYIDREGILWISYIGFSGKRNYIARRRLDNSIIYGAVK